MVMFWYVSEETFEFMISGFLLVEFMVCFFCILVKKRLRHGKKIGFN